MSAQAATHLMDTYIARTTPTLPMPHGPFEALAQPGHRFLVAREGLYLEARRRWLHAVLPLAASPVALPYGSATAVQGVQLLCNSIPDALLREFEQLARAAFPGCRHFGRTNGLLEKPGKTPIDWRLHSRQISANTRHQTVLEKK